MHSSRRSLLTSGVINRKGFRINLKEEYLGREGKNKHVERERERERTWKYVIMTKNEDACKGNECTLNSGSLSSIG